MIMNEMMRECPACQCPYGYEGNANEFTCPECSFEWTHEEEKVSDELVVIDALGTRLNHGDTVVVVKDLPVKGAPKAVKAGTKVKNIRLAFGDHNIDCKIDGFGSMALKSEFVKKA